MTYFGEGHHASLGVGYFRANAILFQTASNSSINRVDRGLLNVEASFAWGPLFLCAEYFRFSGITEDFSTPNLNTGNSDGWYVIGEYVLTKLNYLAPFFKYERWNRFREASGYLVESSAIGANLYLMGNSFRVGITGQRDQMGTSLGAGTVNIVRMTSQILF
ncbi:hypothetical protein EBR03_03195 [bacterium]|nr:hypothetical protein [bacterium]